MVRDGVMLFHSGFQSGDLNRSDAFKEPELFFVRQYVHLQRVHSDKPFSTNIAVALL